MELTKEVLESAGKFTELASKELCEMVEQAIDEMAADMADSEVEISFAKEDMHKVIQVANKVGIAYKLDDEGTSIEILEDDEDKLDAFFAALDDEEISYSDESEDEMDGEMEMEEGLDESELCEVCKTKKKKMQEGEELELCEVCKGKRKKKMNEEDLDEVAASSRKRVHTAAADKLAHQKAYRKNKATIKLRQKRFRKTSHYKRWRKRAKIKSRIGQTAYGKRQVKRI